MHPGDYQNNLALPITYIRYHMTFFGVVDHQHEKSAKFIFDEQIGPKNIGLCVLITYWRELIMSTNGLLTSNVT